MTFKIRSNLNCDSVHMYSCLLSKNCEWPISHTLLETVVAKMCLASQE